MAPRALLATSGVIAAFFAIYGCSKDDTNNAPSRISLKGEACQVSNDCATGLACVPIPGGAVSVCTVGSFAIAQTAKECAITECSVAADCCATQPSNCTSLQDLCNADAGSSSQQACQQYDLQCKCNENKVACEQSRCISKCTIDNDCLLTGTGRKCAGGKCVQCATDSECQGGQMCLNGACQAPCLGDGDCAGFQRCQAGKCTEGGCQTDRECVASTRNVEATCGTDGKCIVPCQTDLECGNPKSYSFFSCITNQCIYTGCQSDKDCRLLLTGSSDSGTLPPKQHVVCRDKTVTGNVTKPALSP